MRRLDVATVLVGLLVMATALPCVYVARVMLAARRPEESALWCVVALLALAAGGGAMSVGLWRAERRTW